MQALHLCRLLRGPRVRRLAQRADGGEDLAHSTAGFFDGRGVDTQGHLWIAAGDGVHCHAPDGTLIGPVIDPFDGQRDLRARVFRHVSDAFVEDPVRILRLARFAARADLSQGGGDTR